MLHLTEVKYCATFYQPVSFCRAPHHKTQSFHDRSNIKHHTYHTYLSFHWLPRARLWMLLLCFCLHHLCAYPFPVYRKHKVLFFVSSSFHEAPRASTSMFLSWNHPTQKRFQLAKQNINTGTCSSSVIVLHLKWDAKRCHCLLSAFANGLRTARIEAGVWLWHETASEQTTKTRVPIIRHRSAFGVNACLSVY